jgi:polyhydroxyalkanoate synthase
MFNLLRANDLIWSTVVNNYLTGNRPPAFDLLYWNSDGTRMAPAAHSFYLRNTYLENNFIKPSKVSLLGRPIDLSRIAAELYAVGAEKDHIVPWRSAWRIARLTRAKTRFVLAASGHIAGHDQSANQRQGRLLDERCRHEARDRRGVARRRATTRGQLVDGLDRVAGSALWPEAAAAGDWQRRASTTLQAPGTYVLET